MSAGDSGETVKVIVRCRPLSSKEVASDHHSIVDIERTLGRVSIERPERKNSDYGRAAAGTRPPPKVFTFDAAYGPNTEQIDIFTESVRPLIDSVLSGYNGTIFAYGQTGSGKTFTMSGIDQDGLRGIIPNSFVHIFDHIAEFTERAEDPETFLISISYLELYNEEVRDLLVDKPHALKLKQHPELGVYVEGLSQHRVNSEEEIDRLIAIGTKHRTVAATYMNEESSRSHSIFTVRVEASSVDEEGEEHIRVGKLNLVDLAGSEKQKKTGATGQQLVEAAKINLSLSTLSSVVSKLVTGAPHIPYRDSKLTRLLQDSLGGNAKTVMIANIGPSNYNYDETHSTLLYADRAKKIKNKPVINEDPKDAMLREMRTQIEALRNQLAAAQGVPGGGEPGAVAANAAAAAADIDSLRAEIRMQLERELEVKRVKDRLDEAAAAADHAGDAVSEEEAARLAAERAQLETEAEKARAERERLNTELEAKQRESSEVQENVDKMARQLKSMQAQLLEGGSFMKRARKQQRLLRKARNELCDREQERLQLERDLKLREEAARQAEAEKLQLRTDFESAQEELEAKAAAFTQLSRQLDEARQEVADVEEEADRRIGDLEDEMRATRTALTREAEFFKLVVQHFVPPPILHKIRSFSRWDDDTQTWYLGHADATGNARREALVGSLDATQPRARTLFAAEMASDLDPSNPRFRDVDAVGMSLDMPEPARRSYEATYGHL
jgi:kinesin family protein 3/17